MQDDEQNRFAAIAALLAMLLVSATIVALTFWSGDLFGPWTSVPPAAAESPRIEALRPMLHAREGAGPERIEGRGDLGRAVVESPVRAER